MATTLKDQDRREFKRYLKDLTDRQVLGVMDKETDAGRVEYARLARDEAEIRKLVEPGDEE